MKNAGYFILGTLIGSVMAGIAVLLLTPLSGDNLRKEIGDRTHIIIEDVKQASIQRQEELKAELENLRLGKNIKVESNQ
jgi:gas vesicle protein